MKPAIIIIDVINDFVTGTMGSKRAATIIPCIRRLLLRAREVGVPVIYVTDAHLAGIDREFDVWGEHAVSGSWGAQIVEEIKPEKEDYRILKRRYSGFYATDLDALLRELNVDAVVLTGLVTHICIQHTAADAFFRGYRVIVPSDCVETTSDVAQEISLKFMEENYGAKITTPEEVIDKDLLGG